MWRLLVPDHSGQCSSAFLVHAPETRKGTVGGEVKSNALPSARRTTNLPNSSRFGPHTLGQLRGSLDPARARGGVHNLSSPSQSSGARPPVWCPCAIRSSWGSDLDVYAADRAPESGPSRR